jgi:hypothetical protein
MVGAEVLPPNPDKAQRGVSMSRPIPTDKAQAD